MRRHLSELVRHLGTAVLTLAVFSAVAYAAGPSSKTLVRVQTWGAPWEESFDMTVDSQARLVVVKSSRGSGSKNRRKSVTINLTPVERDSIQGMARQAIADPSRNTGCSTGFDGTNASLAVLMDNGREERIECLHADRWPAPGTSADALIRFVNAKLPDELHVH